ncbi:MAG: gliding motility-associated C-terminal domain-containing protein, partial [Saprospiraceae bacterium]
GFTSSLQNPVINSAGNYTLKLTGTNYCTALDSLSILMDTIKPRLQLQFDSINCLKREVDLIALVLPNQLVGSWTLSNNQTVNLNSIKTREGGTYSFNVTAPNYCTNSQTIFIPVDTIAPDLKVQDDTLNCIKQLAQIQAMSQTTGLLYDWTGPGNFKSNSSQINIAIPGKYTINITGKNFCTQTAQVSVSIDTIHPELITQSDTIDCIHTEANLIATTNVNSGIFSWKDSQGNLLTNQLVYKTKKPGDYHSEIVNPLNGCRTQKTQTVLADSLIITDVLIQATNPTCGNKIGSAQIAKVIGGHSGLRYSIDFKKTYSGNPNLNQLTAGHYTLFVLDNQNCEFQKDFDIIELPYIETNLQPEITISLGDSTKLDLDILSDRGLINSISWNPTDDLSCSNCEDPFASPWVSRFYTVTVIDTNGCESTQRIHILVEIPKVWVPNVFSPNGDNINDWLTIFGSKAEVTKINIFQVFDRWGNRVFESKEFQPNDLIHGWNGNYQGEKCNPGVYVYWGEVELINGLKWVVKGDVTLIR